MTYSINDKALGFAEPIRVKQGQRVLLHLLNASAIENRRLALPGHKFKVLALDGTPVPKQAEVETLFLGAGERIDAVVEMNNPGVWILGATEDEIRGNGLGIVVEYANQHKHPEWVKPSSLRWDYTVFGAPQSGQPAKDPDHTFDMVFEKIPGGDDGPHGTELWKSNGTSLGTVLVRDINPGSYAPSNVNASAAAAGRSAGDRASFGRPVSGAGATLRLGNN